MFKIGDTLVCTETNLVELSANSITTGEEYVVIGLWEDGVRIVNDDGEKAGVCDYRFKLKEEAKVEKKECLFKKGQVVWDLIDGKGVVTELEDHPQYPVRVTFDSGGYEDYTHDGRKYEDDKVRSLYFSEPKIEAATEPVFELTLKEGDIVVYKNTYSNYYGVGEVEEEDEDSVSLVGDDSAMRKSAFDFYRLGEKINFK